MPPKCHHPASDQVQWPSLTLSTPSPRPPTDSSALLLWYSSLCLMTLTVPCQLWASAPLSLAQKPASLSVYRNCRALHSEVLPGAAVLGLLPWCWCRRLPSWGMAPHLVLCLHLHFPEPQNTPCQYHATENHSNHLHCHLHAPRPGSLPLQKVYKSPCVLFYFFGGVLVSSQENVHSTIEGHTIVPE